MVTVAAVGEAAALPAVPASPTNAASGVKTANACCVFPGTLPARNGEETEDILRRHLHHVLSSRVYLQIPFITFDYRFPA